MGRIIIEVDDDLVERAMRMYGLRTKHEAVHLALERLVGSGPIGVDEQLAMRWLGWEGDLDALRRARFADDPDR